MSKMVLVCGWLLYHTQGGKTLLWDGSFVADLVRKQVDCVVIATLANSRAAKHSVVKPQWRQFCCTAVALSLAIVLSECLALVA